MFCNKLYFTFLISSFFCSFVTPHLKVMKLIPILDYWTTVQRHSVLRYVLTIHSEMMMSTFSTGRSMSSMRPLIRVILSSSWFDLQVMNKSHKIIMIISIDISNLQQNNKSRVVFVVILPVVYSYHSETLQIPETPNIEIKTILS